MGYLVKFKEEYTDHYRVFYSKPSNGYYIGDEIALSREEYDKGDIDVDDYVFMHGWCDTSEPPFSKDSFGHPITDNFLLDSILQGKHDDLEYEVPYEFELILK